MNKSTNKSNLSQKKIKNLPQSKSLPPRAVQHKEGRKTGTRPILPHGVHINRMQWIFEKNTALWKNKQLNYSCFICRYKQTHRPVNATHHVGQGHQRGWLEGFFSFSPPVFPLQTHYITCHLADAFIQSDLQLIRLD